MAPKKKSTKATGKGKVRELVTLSEVARRYDVTRQSALTWYARHETFPEPVIADEAVLTLKVGNDTVKYEINDPHGKTLYFDFSEVEAWKESGVLRERSAAKPKAAKKKAATGKKATTTKKASSKKATTEKSTAKKSTKKKAAATVSKKATVKKGGKKGGSKKVSPQMKREAAKRKAKRG